MILSNIMYPEYLSCGQSPCRNVPGISTVITFLLSSASITHEPIWAYNDTIGELDSSLVIYFCWGRPLAQPLPFISPLYFLLSVTVILVLEFVWSGWYLPVKWAVGRDHCWLLRGLLVVVGHHLHYLYHLLGHLLGRGLVCSVIDSGSSQLLLDLIVVI